jgi:dienelactone hydrolase
MADIVMFHHILGLTPGVEALADDLRVAGHTVHTPDLYAGRVFDSIEGGAAFAGGPEAPDAESLADAAVAELPSGLVYLGISFGVMQAQRLAQTRPGAAGAVLLEACLPITGEWAFGPWPEGVPMQIHGMDADPIFAGEGDVDAARAIVAEVPDAELHLYPGNVHLFEDRFLPSYDEQATRLLTERVLEFIDRTSPAAAD